MDAIYNYYFSQKQFEERKLQGHENEVQFPDGTFHRYTSQRLPEDGPPDWDDAMLILTAPDSTPWKYNGKPQQGKLRV